MKTGTQFMLDIASRIIENAHKFEADDGSFECDMQREEIRQLKEENRQLRDNLHMMAGAVTEARLKNIQNHEEGSRERELLDLIKGNLEDAVDCYVAKHDGVREFIKFIINSLEFDKDYATCMDSACEALIGADDMAYTICYALYLVNLLEEERGK